MSLLFMLSPFNVEHYMCSVGVKNILHRQAVVVGNPYFDLIAWDTLPTFIHEKCGFADSERICNNFCILVTAQVAQTLTNLFAIYFCHPLCLCTYCTRMYRICLFALCTNRAHMFSALFVLDSVHVSCYYICVLLDKGLRLWQRSKND